MFRNELFFATGPRSVIFLCNPAMHRDVALDTRTEEACLRSPSHYRAAVLLPRPRAVHAALGRDKVEVAQQLRALGDLGGRHVLPGNHRCVFREAPRGRRSDDRPDGLTAEFAAKVRRKLREAGVVAAAAHAARAAERGSGSQKSRANGLSFRFENIGEMDISDLSRK